MISENIKNLRVKKGLTQKDLAEKLHVTSQAVSRWEKGDVEPSVDTIINMAKIFEVTTDEIMSGESSQIQKSIEEPKVIEKVVEKVVVEQAKPVLAVCESCNKPIYDGDDIVRRTITHGRSPSTQQVLCKLCEYMRLETIHKNQIKNSKKQRTKSYIWGSIAAVVVLLLGLWIFAKDGVGAIVGTVFTSIFSFTFVSCILLKNNFVEDMFIGIASWGFVKLPGIIFEFSLDGFVFLIVVKVLFWIFGMLLAFFAVVLGFIISLPISGFTYPYALVTSIKHPDKTEDI